jgi:hypothetical protein
LDESLQILSLLIQSVDRLLESPSPLDGPRREVTATDSSESVVIESERLHPADAGGFVRFLISMFAAVAASAKSSVGREEVEQFFNEPTPRTTPERIEGQNVRLTAPIALPTLIVCVPFFLFGAVTILLGAMAMNAALAAAGGVSLLLIAAALGLIAGSHRRRAQLLREGVVASATIRNVRSRRDACRADVEYLAGGQRYARCVTLRGSQVELARDCANGGGETPMLYDPRRPKRFLLGLQLTSTSIGSRSAISAPP